MVAGMNGNSHAMLAKWALSSVTINDDSRVLDIGCGGGGNIARLLQLCPNGFVAGIDYSPVSVKKSIEVNAAAIARKRCDVKEGNVASLPYGDEEFDLVTAFETVYFWPTIEDSFRQVLRVLKPGGRFVIVNEADGEEQVIKWDKVVDGMHTYNSAELQEHLTNAGFADTDILHDQKKHRLCMTAYKK
jgi:ubiquinone/menaquinone biosynthesis C-methylase UbiE